MIKRAIKKEKWDWSFEKDYLSSLGILTFVITGFTLWDRPFWIVILNFGVWYFIGVLALIGFHAFLIFNERKIK